MTSHMKLVYAGLMRTDETLLHCYFKVSDRGFVEADMAQVFAEPLVDCQVGAIYSFKTSPDGSRVHKTGASFVGVLQDQGMITQWRAAHDAITMSERAWIKPALDPVFEVLQPLRLAYRNLPEEQRGVLIAQVVRFIVGNQ